jgi:uroporphyrinogen decarboxylase
VPISLVCAGINVPAYEDLQVYLMKERKMTVEEYLDPLVDIMEIEPGYIGPQREPLEDYWGVIRKMVSYGRGGYEEIEYYPLKPMNTIDDLEKYNWPVTDWFDYSRIPEQIKKFNDAGKDYCFIAKGGNIFETSWYMRGFEQTFMDLVLDPEFSNYIIVRVTDFYCEHTKKILEAAGGKMDLMFTADDLAGQEGLLMSLKMFEASLKPYHKKLNSVIHGFGAKSMYHTDGAVMAVVPGLIDMGIDVLEALQFDAKGMDPVILKDKYGDRLCFSGGVSVQKTMPFGTPEDVRREVEERIKVLGKNGGYLCGPSHNVQSGTKPENIVALFDTAITTKMY